MAFRGVCVSAAIILTLAMGPSLAAGPSGTVLAVVQAANIDGATGKTVIQPEQPVYSGDRVETDAKGSAQIKFRDNTKLVVGPSSSMVIDAFVFSDSNTARQVSIDVLKGTLRFMTGTSPKDAYSIKTPTATIAVRGTEFDVAIENGGATRVANFEGQTHICPLAGAAQAGSHCTDVKDPCSVSLVRPAGSDVKSFGAEDIAYRNRQLKYYFPYVRSQDTLLNDFRVNLKQCGLADNLISPDAAGPPGAAPAPGSPPTPPPSPPAPTPPSSSPPPAPGAGGTGPGR